MRLVLVHLRELWRYRVLIDALVRREVKSRYRGSVFGFLWTLLNPLMLLLVYRFVFTQATNAVTIKNYAVYLFVGLLPWQWLAQSIANGAMSIVQGRGLITRVCMPPQVLPAVQVLANLVNFALALPVAAAAAVWYGLLPTPAYALLPLVVAIELVFLYGVTLTVATLSVRYRDVQFIAQNLIMVWFFLTPIAYSIEDRNFPERLRPYILLNPAASLVMPYQAILHGRAFPEAAWLATGAAFALAVGVGAILLFEGQRGSIAEEL